MIKSCEIQAHNYRGSTAGRKPDPRWTWKHHGGRVAKALTLADITPTPEEREALRSRFWSRVDCTGDCWLWVLAPCGDGYGAFKVGKLQIKAHRLAYLLRHGEVPARMLAHSCDEKLCCNPAHLSPSTAKQNYREVLERGLDCVAKLNYEKVRELRRRSGESRVSLAREYGVSPTTVSSAISGRTWRHVS